MSRCDESSVGASLAGLDKVEATLLDDFSRPRGLLSWDQAETARCAFSSTRYAGFNTTVVSRGLLVRLRLNWPFTCVTWTVLERKVSQALSERDGDESVNEQQKSWLRSLVGVLGYLAAGRLESSVPCQEPHERNHLCNMRNTGSSATCCAVLHAQTASCVVVPSGNTSGAA